MGRPVIQIYTMQTASEAVAVASRGVDHVGVTPANCGLPGEVDSAAAANICLAVRGLAKSVALSVESDLGSIVDMVAAVQPDILHLCGPPGSVGPGEVGDLRSRIGGIPVMQAIAVTGPDAVDVARSFEPVADYLILDSVDPAIAGIGAAGKVHDWNLSAAIVDAVDIPVILAGGLSPENVAEAIAAVRPWGVDSLTRTNVALGEGGFRKDLDRVAQFVRAAHSERRP